MKEPLRFIPAAPVRARNDKEVSVSPPRKKPPRGGNFFRPLFGPTKWKGYLTKWTFSDTGVGVMGAPRDNWRVLSLPFQLHY